MVYVIKRNKEKELFDIKKIATAIYKVFDEIGEVRTMEQCLDMAHYLTTYYHEAGMEDIDIEAIQDDVEMYLLEMKEIRAFKAYSKYRAIQEEGRNNPWSDMDERQETILSKYTMDGESKKEFIKRVSNGNPKVEKILRNKEAIFGGRNLFAIGRPGNITGSNCYVAKDPEDSLQDIYRADYHIARTYSYGGGQGMNLSKLRPKDALVNNSSNTSPGPMVFAEKYSHTTLNTQQAKRRGALMLVMNIDHPDIVDFATAKLDLEKINGANISIAITDLFMHAVVEDRMWDMSFRTPYEHIVKTVKARDLLKVIAYANHTMGDPGMLFIDNVNNYHLLSEYEDVYYTATNPCGEQPLAANGSCNLASINLNAFVRNPFTPQAYFDVQRFQEVVYEMTWALDDLLDLLGDRHALEEQRDHVKLWREIGLGVMGLADLALSFSTAYGGDLFNVKLEEIMASMANFAAQASALRAKEKGTFPKYDWEKVSNSEFFKTVYRKDTVELIKQYGLRNSRLLSIAPTGSISNVLGVSGGVEPYFMLGYLRRIISMFEDERVVTVWEKTPQKLAKHLGIKTIEELPEWAKVTSQNIQFEDRAEVQAIIQKYVDTAISSTFNVPNYATVEEIMEIYITAWTKGLKGATVFRDNCAKIGVLTGQDAAEVDHNPADPVSIEIHETWTEHGKESRHYVNVVEVSLGETKDNKIEKEICPLCGDVLVKRGGCTKCRNNDCVYEKCAI